MNDVEQDAQTEISIIDQFRTVLLALGKGMETFRQRANEFAAVVGPLIVQLRANTQQLPDRIITFQRTLAERGWYILPEMPVTSLFDLADDFAKGRTDVVDNRMGQMVERCMNKLEAQLSSDFPTRAELFKEAFQAHNDSRYASAVTLLLTQVDGICAELFGVVFFSVERGTSDPRTRRLVEELELDVFEHAILEPLMTRGGVSARDNELDLYPESLHRHQILHGKDTAYANKMNSLKAISLVGYIGGLAKHTIDRANARRSSGAAASEPATH